MSHNLPDLETFQRLAQPGRLVPMFRRLMSDQLTPVLAYRRLVRSDARMAPSFLLESVEGGQRAGRYSYLAARPAAQIIARGHEIQRIELVNGNPATANYHSDDPLGEMDRYTARWNLAPVDDMPEFTGGWVGFAGYDTIRYLEGEKLTNPPPDDRRLPDLHFGLYRQVVAFDHARKVVIVMTHVAVDDHPSPQAAYEAGSAELDDLVRRIETPTAGPGGELGLPAGAVDLHSPPPKLPVSNMGEGGYQHAVLKCKTYIAAGDAFQIVPSQRFELRTRIDPFDIYRALRVVNPSPYMFYLQIEGGMLVGSSPEILCRVRGREVTNRPLAGTRRRGHDAAEDAALEAELLADPKDRAEHIMLVDLGRNDVGRVCEPATINLPEIMTIERYSHVMHISSTVTGTLKEGCTCWDALRYTLPVGTVSGAPKVRAMQIIDELEPTRRGPYAGAVGYADFAGNLDMAIALRTMVILPGDEGEATDVPVGRASRPPEDRPKTWRIHLQAGGGIVADSDPDAEHQETVNKAAALAKAVAVAETAFGGGGRVH